MKNRSQLLALASGSIACGLIFFSGCSRPERPIEFEPNLVHAMKYQIKEGVEMDQVSDDAFWIVDQYFGTPDDPKLPELITEDEDLAGLISQERLTKASGPADAPGRGLYRKHCVSCHGVTGNGRGVNAAISDPYPRDYRPGIFKFKSTERGSKPLREDLARSVRNGITGTTMLKIPELSEDDIQTLVDYVIYLSMRGEMERSLIDDAVGELDIEAGDRLVDTQLAARIFAGQRAAVESEFEAWEASSKPADDDEPTIPSELDLELYDESMGYVNDALEGIAFAWLEAEDDLVDVPEPPADIPVADSHEEFVALQQGDQAAALAASIKRGQEVFTGKVASCSKCHGATGRGDGQNKDYDDWTKDWTTRGSGIDPTDLDALTPMMARGAMPPKFARPRNFSEGVFRGGEAAEHLYRRIYEGIEGSPMPSSTFVPGDYEEVDIWHLINFIRSLKAPADQV